MPWKVWKRFGRRVKEMSNFPLLMRDRLATLPVQQKWCRDTGRRQDSAAPDAGGLPRAPIADFKSFGTELFQSFPCFFISYSAQA
jgi:hypothetical protein